jgi:glyoxylase-like metal-dependent hydrolase (beta-lactamase superfamily II)
MLLVHGLKVGSFLTNLFLTTVLLVPTAQADTLVKFEPVAPGVFAFIGEIGARTIDNQGLNANIGLIETPEGNVLIDSGATWLGAEQIEQAAKKVSNRPIRWVINTGGQDHRWLGNGYFQSKQAQVIAHERGKKDMETRGGDHLTALTNLLGKAAEKTQIAMPNLWLQGDSNTLVLGGTTLVLISNSGGHTPGDVMVWLPQTKVLFSGDIVYLERLLSVLPVSSTKAWMKALEAIEQLDAIQIVPGHGKIGDKAAVKSSTTGYLTALRSHMKKAVDAGQDISEAIKQFDSSPWKRLANADSLHPGNASRVYLELELE